MKTIFVLVMHALQWCAAVTGLTYNEINIIVFYMIIPFVYAAMLDGIIRRQWIKFAVVAAWVLTLLAGRRQAGQVRQETQAKPRWQ